jgi:prepilin-type N-terminal cleavage/methylation domain-containing protein
MTRRHRKARTARGFSLIEVAIATGIFSLLAGLLFAAMWSGHLQMARLKRPSSEAEQILTLRRLMVPWLESATVTGGVNGDVASVFQGDAAAISFVTTPSDRGGAMGLYRVEVRIDPLDAVRDAGSRLVVQRQRLSPQGSVYGEVESGELMRSSRSLRFSFFDLATRDGAEQGEWMESWIDFDRMPVRVQLHDGETPLFTATIAIAKDPRCLLRRGLQMMVGGECTVR